MCTAYVLNMSDVVSKYNVDYLTPLMFVILNLSKVNVIYPFPGSTGHTGCGVPTDQHVKV